MATAVNVAKVNSIIMMTDDDHVQPAKKTIDARTKTLDSRYVTGHILRFADAWTDMRRWACVCRNWRMLAKSSATEAVWKQAFVTYNIERLWEHLPHRNEFLCRTGKCHSCYEVLERSQLPNFCVECVRREAKKREVQEIAKRGNKQEMQEYWDNEAAIIRAVVGADCPLSPRKLERRMKSDPLLYEIASALGKYAPDILHYV
jgi:hypothetical protein